MVCATILKDMKPVSDKFQIELLINNQIQKITVLREQEKLFRDGAQLINNCFNNYRQKFPSKSNDVYSALVMLELAVQFLQNKNNNDTKPLVDAMAQITREVEETLGENTTESK